MDPLTWALMASGAILVVVAMCFAIWTYDKRQAEEVSHDQQRRDPGPSVNRIGLNR